MRQAGLPLSAPRALPTTTLLHGDCLEVMPTLSAGSVQFVFADLPYGSTQCKWDSRLPLHEMWPLIDRVSRINAAKVFTASNPFASALIASNFQNFRYDLVWFKTRLSGHLNAKKMPMRAHELLAVFYSQQPCFNPQMRKNVSGRAGIFLAGKTETQCYGKDKRNQTYTLGQPLLPHSVITAPSPHSERGLHPTQKPVALLEWLIKTYTSEGDTVLDPTAGSGTTAVAALRTSRHSICIEKDKAYYDIMCSRVAAERERLSSGAGSV